MKSLFDKSRLFLILGIILCFVGYFYSQKNTRRLIRISGSTMGTQYLVIVSHSAEKKVSKEGLQNGIDQLLKSINDQMSTYIETSELSLFNRSRSVEPFAISMEHFQVARMARDISRQTEGAFDPTIAPLVRLWGFGANAGTPKYPTASQVKSQLENIGYEKWAVGSDESQPSLRKTVGELELDFSAIAKGFAVDLVSRYLTKLHFSNHMVEIGGEIRLSGTKGRDLSWTIGIEMPESDRRSVHKKLTITNISVATSGSYRSYVELKGRKYSHTIDPRTGRPVEHKMVSVTVFDDQCGAADALATAFMVMGPEETMTYANKHQIAVYLLKEDGNKVVAESSQAFQTLVSEKG